MGASDQTASEHAPKRRLLPIDRGWRAAAMALMAVWAAASVLLCAGGAEAAGPTVLRAPQWATRSDAGPIYPVPSTSTTTLSVLPNAGVTNRTLTLTALLTSSTSLVPPSGTVTFYFDGNPLDGCVNLPVATQSQSTTVTCHASFAASTSPERLRAVFVPVTGSLMAGSSNARSIIVSRGASSLRVKASHTRVTFGSKVTFTATVNTRTGPVSPSGVVRFRAGGKPVPGCAKRRLRGLTATCTLSYPTTGAHKVTAVYRGDHNFLSSPTASSPSVEVVALGTIAATMKWTFSYRPTYTLIDAFSFSAVPAGGTVAINCHGAGCPFATESRHVPSCGPALTHGCDQTANFSLESSFHRRRLRVGTAINVEITRPGWIGKYYLFTMAAGRGPNIQISCVAPGQTVPGRGC